MKSIRSLITVFCTLAAGGLHAAEFYVAPTGSDTNPGTSAKPFATLERARDAVRQSKIQDPRSKIEIVVRSGTYELRQTLKFDAADSGSEKSPVVWRAYRNEKPVLVGGGAITGFMPHEGRILKADVRAQGFTNQFRQLFFDGRRQELARYPNLDPAKPFESGWTFTDKDPVKTEALKRTLRYAAADARLWARPTDGEVCIFPTHEWWNNIWPIAAVDREQRTLTLRRDCSYEVSPGDRYFVRGLLEELDAPGEWYLDREKGTLYFWPPAPIEKQQVCAPKLRTMLELGPGAAHLTFRGFTFECCDGTAIVLNNTTNCLIAGCTIRNVGDYNGSGVSVTGGARNGAVGCEISDTGSHGISISGGDEKTLTPAGNYAENNLITRTGAFHKQGCGVTVSGTGNRVSRNWLHHLPRFGIMATGQNHVIELNHIHHISLETMDTAAIYVMSLNWLWGHGTIIRNNFIHDVIGRSGKAGKWLAPYFAWGIYLDWTAMGVTVTGNIVARTPRSGIHVHDGRDNVIANNILVECGTGRSEHGATSQIEFNGWDTSYGWWKREIENWSRQYDSVANLPAWRNVASLRDPRTVPLPDGRTMQRNVASRNILCWSNPQPQAFQFKNLSFAHNLSDSNLLWHAGAPIKTGQFKLKSVTGPNLAPPNAGFEQGMPGKLPDRWGWHIRPSTNDHATLSTDSPHGGRGCLRITGKLIPANKNKESWARIPSVKSIEVPAQPGQVYCLNAWLRADQPNTRVELGLQAYRPNTYTWQSAQTVAVGTEWSRHELVARFPTQPLEMKSFYVRIRLPDGDGAVCVDDVELHAAEPMDEWAAWQALGMDRHSLVAEPRFVNAAKDDYRLKPDSPAFELGFKRIPVEKIGCYRDPLRASWPIVEKEKKP
ncbi:MAG: right-handed parallel beta-helix repeat-containing protein [Verrucomicrobiia bacterium]|jgi:parallel beta-helix repeat protein